MLSLNILVAISNWLQARKTQGPSPDPNIVPLTLPMYKTLDTLYLETKNKLPLSPTGKVNKKDKDKPDAITFDLWLSDEGYMLFFDPFWL